MLHSSTVITLYSITWYYTQHCRNRDWISIRCWIHKTHPIPRPDGRTMGCLSWIFLAKIYHIITAPHCIIMVSYLYYVLRCTQKANINNNSMKFVPVHLSSYITFPVMLVHGLHRASAGSLGLLTYHVVISLLHGFLPYVYILLDIRVAYK